MSKSHGPRALTLVALVAMFVAGVLVDGWLRTYGPPKPAQAVDVRLEPSASGTATGNPAGIATGNPAGAASATVLGTRDVPIGDASETASLPPAPLPSLSAPPGASVPSLAPGLGRAAGTSGSLSAPPLRVPIDGVNAESFKGGFAERRGSDRPHEAVDILVPRGTPIHAVTDGTVAKLFFSKAGGTTIYEFDGEQRLCYYYAHLDRYADGLHEGQHVAQGEVIGYVGTSGNAPANTPHLHFAVFALNGEKHWWQGQPLDPYTVFKSGG